MEIPGVSERGVELCVECPLYGKYVPVVGNCYVRTGEGFDQNCTYAVARRLEESVLRGVSCSYRP